MHYIHRPAHHARARAFIFKSVGVVDFLVLTIHVNRHWRLSRGSTSVVFIGR
jgi:hypothetical protein